MPTIATVIHIRATTLRILADKLEESVSKKDMEELLKTISIVGKVSHDLLEIASTRQVQYGRKRN